MYYLGMLHLLGWCFKPKLISPGGAVNRIEILIRRVIGLSAVERSGNSIGEARIFYEDLATLSGKPCKSVNNTAKNE